MTSQFGLPALAFACRFDFICVCKGRMFFIADDLVIFSIEPFSDPLQRLLVRTE